MSVANEHQASKRVTSRCKICSNAASTGEFIASKHPWASQKGADAVLVQDQVCNAHASFKVEDGTTEVNVALEIGAAAEAR